MITKHNYEEYALEYLEGDLDSTLSDQFELFLEAHPDIALEMDGLLEYSLTPTTWTAEDTERLLKTEAAGLPRIWYVVAFLLIGAVTAYFWAGTDNDTASPSDEIVVPNSLPMATTQGVEEKPMDMTVESAGVMDQKDEKEAYEMSASTANNIGIASGQSSIKKDDIAHAQDKGVTPRVAAQDDAGYQKKISADEGRPTDRMATKTKGSAVKRQVTDQPQSTPQDDADVLASNEGSASAPTRVVLPAARIDQIDVHAVAALESSLKAYEVPEVNKVLIEDAPDTAPTDPTRRLKRRRPKKPRGILAALLPTTLVINPDLKKALIPEGVTIESSR